MEDKTRGPDAADVAPRPVSKTREKGAPTREQDAPSAAERTDSGQSIPADKLNSANDE